MPDREHALSPRLQMGVAQFSAVMNAISDGIIIWDPDLRITFVNDAVIKLTGLPGRAWVGSDVAALFQRFQAQETVQRDLLAILRQVREQPFERTVALLHLEYPRRLVLETTTTPAPWTGAEHPGHVTVLHDVTREQMADETKRQFLSIAVHELRTPVTCLKGYAQMALRKLKRGQEAKSVFGTLQAIITQSDRLAGLISDFLDAARMQEGELQLSLRYVNVVAMLRAAVVQSEETAPTHVFTIEAPADREFIVWADEARLRQVLSNLLHNSIKFSPDGGNIALAVSVLPGFVQVQVSDQGIGIPPEHIDAIFSLFSQADSSTTRRFGGMGLGLPVSKGIIEQHGGRLWVESTLGQGSVFSFTLPTASNEGETRGDEMKEERGAG